MMVFKRRQVVVLSLVLMIVVAGYLQYSYKKSGSTVGSSDNAKLGEAVYVDSNGAVTTSAQDNKSKVTAASKQANDFFAQARVERETLLSQDTETLKQITSDTNAAKETKTKAYDQMIKMTDLSKKELNIETLVKEKGFSDCIALFDEDGGMDIVVKAPELNANQVASICDIASRQAKVTISKIHVRNMY